MDGAAGDLDRISALPDDLLHIILGSVGSAPSIAKTAVLSRRWRHVWPHAMSLTFYLQLWSVLFGKEDGSTALSDFVMSCCPRLRRLEISRPTGLTQLLLHTEVLEELVITYAHDLKTLDVMTPNLRVIEMDLSTRNGIKMRIMAPRLEEIHGNFPRKPPDLDICTTPLKNVRVLESVHLDMHGKYHRNGDLHFWLLDNCPGVQHLDVCVCHFPTMFHRLPAMDESLEGEAPFANLRAMVISSHLPKHHLVPSISLLLMRCPHLTSLTIRIFSPVTIGSEKCFYEAVTDKFAIHGKLELESLQEVKITGFSGTDEEMQLVSSLFASKNSIKRMDIGLNFPAKIKKRIRAQAANNIFHELKMKIPCSDQARLNFANKNKSTRYAWTCYWTWL